MCLDLALGGGKPSIICTSDAVVVQGGPVAWLWLFCPVKTVGCPHSPPSCGLHCRHHSLQVGSQRVGSPGEGGEGCGVWAGPLSCVWAGEGVHGWPWGQECPLKLGGPQKGQGPFLPRARA